MKIVKAFLALTLGMLLVTGTTGSLPAADGKGWATKIASGSEMSVSGSSTVHDWVCEEIQVSGNIRVEGFTPGTSPTLDDLMQFLAATPGAAEAEVTVPVKEIHCDKDGMDPKTHKALKANKHPNITYRLTKLKVAAPSSTGGDSFLINTTGELTVAGQTREIGMDVRISRTGDNLVVSGEKALKMTDFGIEKPTAMWGMIKAYDDVTVRFNVGIHPSAREESTGGGR